MIQSSHYQHQGVVDRIITGLFVVDTHLSGLLDDHDVYHIQLGLDTHVN